MRSRSLENGVWIRTEVDKTMTVSLTDIEHALERLSGAALRTPLLRCAELSERTGASVLIKPENLQHIGAFKFRGAYNRIAQLDQDEQRAGVVAFLPGTMRRAWLMLPSCLAYQRQ